MEVNSKNSVERYKSNIKKFSELTSRLRDAYRDLAEFLYSDITEDEPLAAVIIRCSEFERKEDYPLLRFIGLTDNYATVLNILSNDPTIEKWEKMTNKEKGDYFVKMAEKILGELDQKEAKIVNNQDFPDTLKKAE